MKNGFKFKIHTIRILIAVLLVFGVFSSPTTVFATELYDFANFSIADSVAFVEQCNIDISDELAEVQGLAEITHKIVLTSFYYPDASFNFNYDELQCYAEDICAAVRAHMDLSTYTPQWRYSLQFNKVMDEHKSWVIQGGVYFEKWRNYNCYAFAINRVDVPNFYQKGNGFQYQPGDMSGAGSFSPYNVTIQQLAEIVREDLEAMGYTNVSITSTIPTIDATQELICVRMGPWDYHFMRYDFETNAWYHKPGDSAVLRYNTSPDDMVWYTEYSDGTGEYLSPDRTGVNINIYNSEIRYITYSKNLINATNDVETSIDIRIGLLMRAERSMQLMYTTN